MIDTHDPLAALDGLGLPPAAEESVARLLVVERLLSRRRASRLTQFALGPPYLSERRLELEYVEPQRYTNEAPQTRRIEGTRKLRVLGQPSAAVGVGTIHAARATDGSLSGYGRLAGAVIWSPESNTGTGLGDVLVDVGVCPAAGETCDLGVAEAGDEKGEVCTLAVRETGENFQRFACLEDVVDGDRVGDQDVLRAVRHLHFKRVMAAITFAEPEGFAGRHDV